MGSQGNAIHMSDQKRQSYSRIEETDSQGTKSSHKSPSKLNQYQKRASKMRRNDSIKRRLHKDASNESLAHK